MGDPLSPVTPCLLWPLFVLLSPLSTYLIIGRMTNRSVNWHSFYQKWPLFSIFAKFDLKGPPIHSSPCWIKLWGTFLWAPGSSLELILTLKKSQAPSVVLTFSRFTWMSHHGKMIFLHDFLPFLSQNRKTFPLLLKVLTCSKIVFLYVKLPPEPRWKSEAKYS